MSYLSIPQFSPFFSAGMRLMLGCLFLGLAQPVTAQENTLEFNETEGLDVPSGAENEIIFKENEGLEVGGEGNDSAVDAASDAVSNAAGRGAGADAQKYLDRLMFEQEMEELLKDNPIIQIFDGEDLVQPGESLCGRPAGSDAALEIVKRILGEWFLDAEAGYVSVMGTTTANPFLPIPNRRIMFELRRDGLYMIFPRQPPIGLRWAGPDSWERVGDQDVTPPKMISPLDWALFLGCDSDAEMPRLIGTFPVTMPPESHLTMDATVKLLLTGPREIKGYMNFSGVMNPPGSRMKIPFIGVVTITLVR